MKVRPWPLVILALFQVLSPLATILFNAGWLGVKPLYVLGWILEKPPLEIFETLALMPIAGVAIYRMKRWSYVVFFVAMAWSLLANLRRLEYAKSALPTLGILLLYAGPVLLVAYFTIPAVRRTYLDPRVRWWEARRRYLMPAALSLQGAHGAAFSARLENISEGGALCTLPEAATLLNGAQVEVSLEILGQPFRVPGEVMYRLARPDADPSYGLRFLHTGETRARFRRLIDALALLGVPHRDFATAVPWYRGIAEWAHILVTTGRGWLPDVKPTRKG